MPYIKKSDRIRIDEYNNKESNQAELTYSIYKKCLEYLNHNGKRWTTMSEVITSLECSKQEFYRRIIAPYEDIKIEENGDIEL